MLQEYIPVLKKVCALAQELNNDLLKKFDDIDKTNDAKTSAVIKILSMSDIIRESELMQYLLKQDFDTIKVIQTVRIIGCDYPTDKCNSPEKVFSEWKDKLDKDGWESAATEIWYICDRDSLNERIALDENLLRAFSILGIV